MLNSRTKQPLWRELGPVGPHYNSAEEAFLSSVSHYQAARYPLYTRVPDGKGGTTELPVDRYAVVREPDDTHTEYTFLGLASEDRPGLRDQDVARSIDILLPQYPIDTVARLEDRGITLFVLRGPLATVGLDEVCVYYLVTNSSTTAHAFHMDIAPVRSDCMNTLNAAIAAAMFDADLYRGTDGARELEYRLQLFPLLERAQRQVLEVFGTLAKKPLTRAQVAGVLQKTYPALPTPARLRMSSLLEATGATAHMGSAPVARARQRHELDQRERQRRRQRAAEIYDAGAALPPRTGWALFNAIVESEDYDPRNRKGSIPELLFGRRRAIKERALNACLRA